MVHEESEKGEDFSVARVLKLLGLSRSGYYACLNRKPSNQAIRKEDVKKQIQKIYDQSHQNYGAPKIGVLLRRQGYTITDRTVGTYMKEMGIRAQWIKKPQRPSIIPGTDQKLRNILKQKFNPDQPNAVWCTDITYIHTRQEGFVYLTCIMDLFSRKIIAWKLSRTMEAEDVLEALETAKIRRKSDRPIVLHTDQGIHFTCNHYQNLTSDMIRSYSKKGYPYDNACIESFHSLIKREWLNRFELENYWQVYRLCDQYIESFYNPVRIHSHCNYLSPNTFEQMKASSNAQPLTNEKQKTASAEKNG
ncbi:IS3 family transposase [Allobaculum sp. JKK-2023]|uniref:IS3 family transposase n=1 Tax=Allobaculum sp. JKK-2023 TaxID=3108943 RepID=UPI002B0582D0|nr:IS3 family transposase [Allobaculum sp. JKK-2023]